MLGKQTCLNLVCLFEKKNFPNDPKFIRNFFNFKTNQKKIIANTFIKKFKVFIMSISPFFKRRKEGKNLNKIMKLKTKKIQIFSDLNNFLDYAFSLIKPF